MSRLGLGGHRAELCDGSGQIALLHLCQPEAPAALPRVGPVTDRVGEVASFFGGRARRDRVTRDDRRVRPARRGSGSASTDRPSARARPIASAKYARATSALE